MSCGPQSTKRLKRLEPDMAAYIAGLVDGEGCLYASVRRRRAVNNVSGLRVDFEKSLSVGMTDRAVIEWLVEVTGLGTGRRANHRSRHPNHRPMWEWRLQGALQLAELLRAIRPWLRVKAGQADALIEPCGIQATSHTRSRSQENRQRLLVEMIRAAKRV
jgi:hypothetical protein